MEKKVVSKSSKLLLASALLFGAFSLPAFASADSAESTDAISSVATSETVSVADIVPKEYLDKFAGKYSTVEKLLNDTGFKSSATSKKLTSTAEQSGYIKVNNIDEYAALLNYFNDLGNNNNLVLSNQNNIISPMATTPYWYTAEKTLYSDGLMWIKGYVTSHYTAADVIDNTPAVESSIHGYHIGISWTHSLTRTTVTLYANKKGGYTNIVGNLAMNIIWEGIGTIVDKDQEYYMSF
ncbi:hypothetical protein GRF59_09460 [Paenibacillus sp. HJL G12]|uniref:Uncharacterized protein n=1 Tax=Paenibacillus dendrobii TaxID=2691084 RepID=A0A7X3II92_9BACL|nr:hypothetical protein [Paenibacillus dendrobii]MWV43861.1 hypothetical protein [Paenibacillus dendrobii]